MGQPLGRDLDGSLPDAGADAGVTTLDAGTDAAPRDAGPGDAGTDSAVGTCDGTETRQIPCERCGMRAQRCSGGMWVDDGACLMQGECVPGETETGAVCGLCGEEGRTCSATCTWPSFTCVEDATRCDYYVYPEGGTGWSAYRFRPHVSAPSTPIRAAVPLDGTREALVLTDTTWHRLRRGCEPGVNACWVDSGARTDLMPELGTDAVLYATEVPSAFRGDGFQGVDIATATEDHRYRWEVATETLIFDTTNPAPTGSPSTPDRGTTRTTFTVLGNVDGWVSATCGTPPAVPPDYIATIEASEVFVFAPGADCLTFHQEPYTSFGPFAESGAPPLSRVATTFHREGLTVLTP